MQETFRVKTRKSQEVVDITRQVAEASERENERLRGLNYENEQLRNRLETSERLSDQLREEVHRLRTETEHDRKEREEIADLMTTFMNEVLGRLRPQPA